MKKKWLALALAVCMLSVGMTGCSDGATSSSAGSTASTGGTGETGTFESEDLSQGTQIFDDRNVQGKNIKVFAGYEPNEWMRAAAEVYKQKYGGEVTFITATWDTRISQLQQYIESGDSPDLASAYFYDGLSLMLPQLVQPIDDLIDKSNPNYALDLMEKFFTYDGKTYSVVVGTGDLQQKILIYNKDIFKKMMMETPDTLYNKGEWNWDTFRQIAKNVTSAENYGFGTWEDEIFALSNGADPILYDGQTLKLNLEDSKVKEGFQLMYDMINVDKSMVPGKWDSDALFADGQNAMIVGNLSKLATYRNAGIDCGFVPFPKGPSAQEYYSYVYPGGWMVPAGAENPEAGIAYAEILTTGFPAITEKNMPKLTDEEKELYDVISANYTTTFANSNAMFGDAWNEFCFALRQNVPVGTAIAGKSPVIQTAIDDLMKLKK